MKFFNIHKNVYVKFESTAKLHIVQQKNTTTKFFCKMDATAIMQYSTQSTVYNFPVMVN